MADFTKAFDRISHVYIRTVLQKMRLGKYMINFIMSILEGQEAYVRINNIDGRPFPLRCGTRQGNPLSPLIFNIALEPFLRQLETLEGLELSFKGCYLETIHYHAFADDVNIYLNSLRDYRRCHGIIAQFETASNSRLNHSKSKLIGFHRNYPQLESNILPFSKTSVYHNDTKYLGFAITGTQWSTLISKLRDASRLQGYMSLNLITRALGSNIFISSKAVYKDLVHCMSRSELTSMDKAIEDFFPGISASKLHANPKNGGFGLIEMKIQLQGHRAAVLAAILEDKHTWYVQYLRLKLKHHMAKIILQQEHVDISLVTSLDPADFLFEQSDIFYQHLHWTFSDSEIGYLRAWQKVVRRTRSYVGNSLFTSEPNHHGSLRASLRRQPVISTGEQNACLKNQFTSLSRQEHQKGGPIIPDHLTDICLASQNYTRWKKFWRKLYKQEWLHHNDFSAVHLFNFGSYVP
ncbi:hypothetical protein FT663_04754, partial [Candidozyma haemuli var. vulneris]